MPYKDGVHGHPVVEGLGGSDGGSGRPHTGLLGGEGEESGEGEGDAGGDGVGVDPEGDPGDGDDDGGGKEGLEEVRQDEPRQTHPELQAAEGF